MGEAIAFKYKAFVSYSHRDKRWGKWLHRALEDYRIGTDLVGRETRVGPVPKTLRPIFRDRDDFAAGHSLTEQTLAALDASQFLIVICSPNAAKSQYVNEEIRHFKMKDRTAGVIALIVDGEPGGKDRECFPEALRFKVRSDGTISDEREEPIAADARAEGDGKRLALQKIVAALLSVPFDDVRKRDAIADSLRIKVAAACAGICIVAVMTAGYFVWHAREQARHEAFVAEQQKRRDEEQKQRDEEHRKQLAAMQVEYQTLAQKLLGGSTAQAVPGQAQAVGQAVADTVQGAAGGDDRLKRALALLNEKKIEEAVALLRQVAEDKERTARSSGKEAATAYRNLGAIAGLADPRRALDAYLKAAELDPEDFDSLFWAGYIQMDRGYLSDAETRFGQLLASDKIGDWHRYWARLSLGDIRKARGDLNAAMTKYREAGAIADRLAKTVPGHAGWQRDLAASHIKVGDVLFSQGKLDEALKAFRDGLATIDRLAKDDPSNAGRQRDLSVSYERVGNVLVSQGKLDEALKAYRDSLAIADRLAKIDAGDADWQRHLSVAYNKVGDVLGSQGKLDEALKAFHESLSIRDRLAKTDPGNAGWQRDLYSALWRVADVEIQQVDFAAALQKLISGKAIMERLTKADPGNAGWQRDLSVSYNKIGEVLVEQGKLDEALKAFRDNLAIADRLAKADPGNAGWQRDLSVSHSSIGGALMKQNRPAEAASHYRADLAIAERLAAMDPSNAAWQKDLVISHRQVINALRKIGIEKLSGEQRKWLAESETKLAALTKQ